MTAGFVLKIKLYAHDAREDDAEALLGRDLPFVLRQLERLSLDSGFVHRYSSAEEMRHIFDAVVGQAFQPAEDCPCLV